LINALKVGFILWVMLAAQNALAEKSKVSIQPFDSGVHPFVGQVDHIPGQGPKPLSGKPLGAPHPKKKTEANLSIDRLSSNPLYLAAWYYKNFLTKVDGPRCAHQPTCSRFANQAVARHGFWGILMGLERLIRGGRSSSVRWLPEVGSGRTRRFYDPVPNYVIWEAWRFTGFQKAREEMGPSSLQGRK